jgi:hypothetical protein
MTLPESLTSNVPAALIVVVQLSVQVADEDGLVDRRRRALADERQARDGRRRCATADAVDLLAHLGQGAVGRRVFHGRTGDVVRGPRATWGLLGHQGDQ